ncbi:hypothetical protein PISMIDRAFT_476915 [Pisolithus microcarpus 441]|uniref:Uncharacterized protein n=1 Tax=Pisolithus microcarpus 441 TaxID=765257 RepID=A0A0C9ZKC1_9AGAM|nr:hypothetical protein PISMIDRAFT_476915 [Pisolithus microcarpus 441]
MQLPPSAWDGETRRGQTIPTDLSRQGNRQFCRWNSSSIVFSTSLSQLSFFGEILGIGRKGLRMLEPLLPVLHAGLVCI